MKTILTGIKPTGTPHLGNLLGAIRPAIELTNNSDFDRSLYFIADSHALTSIRDPKEYKENVYSVAATWIALGLDLDKAILFKQSDIPEVFELTWMLQCLTPKGDMNRAHSYKAKVQQNIENKTDEDHGVNMGLYNYPILMSADILLYDTNIVPVGKDQIQHIEIARSIAQRANQLYGASCLVEPQELIQEAGAYVPGLDGRKMSKSYGNTISLWETEKKLRKLINKITTDSSAPEEPKNPDDSIIMDLYKLFARPSEIQALEKRYKEGIGWGEAKLALFEVVNEYLSGPREIYTNLMNDKTQIDKILDRGRSQAKELAEKNMKRIRKMITGF